MSESKVWRGFHSCNTLPPGQLGVPLFIAVQEQRLLCHRETGEFLLVEQQLDSADQSRHLLGVYNDSPCYAVDYSESQPPVDLDWFGLRSLLGVVDEELFNLGGRACQIVNWDRQHRFCGRCGAMTTRSDGECSRHCDRCNEFFYPRLSPCIIVVIRRGEHCLLASSSRWEGKFYSALAGFIEPGETVEEALHREVMEEVGIQVTNLSYFGSQPWPFPGQLMLGFHADYLAGDIQVDGEEIVAADWWHWRQLPPHPDEHTLSGRLIRHFVDSCSGEEDC